MPSDFIAIDVGGIPELRKLLDQLPEAVREAAMEAVTEYTLNVVRAYPPHRYVTRREAYGVTFFSDRQRKWFFANLREGKLKIPYQRTQTLRNGWRAIGKGLNTLIVNETPYAGLVMGPGEQSRHAMKIGWQDVDAIVKDRDREMTRRATAAVEKALRKLGA